MATLFSVAIINDFFTKSKRKYNVKKKNHILSIHLSLNI